MTLEITTKTGEKQTLDIHRLYLTCAAGEFQLIDRSEAHTLDILAINNGMVVRPSSGNAIRISETSEILPNA